MAVCGVRVRVLWGGGRTEFGTDWSWGYGARAAEEAGVVGGGVAAGSPGRAGGRGEQLRSAGERSAAVSTAVRRSEEIEICQSCSAFRSRQPGRGRAVAARVSVWEKGEGAGAAPSGQASVTSGCGRPAKGRQQLARRHGGDEAIGNC
jgi:hypothetical protein